MDDLAVGKDIFGLSSLSPFDGDRAEKRWWCDVVGAVASLCATDEMDATEPVDGLRRVANDMDSRFFLGMPPVAAAGVTVAAAVTVDDVVEAVLEAWRGTREVATDGDARTE